MPAPNRFELVARTDTGLVRARNEDAVVVNTACGFAILADGMGGYAGGEVASRIAVDVASRRIEQALTIGDGTQPEAIPCSQDELNELLISACQSANLAILEAARDNPQFTGMGTTFVAAVFQPDFVTIAHVGDSRAYCVHNRTLVQITRDHSLLQEQIDAGLISPAHAAYALHRNLLTRAVGIGTTVETEITVHHTRTGDLYLLCSDGLTDMLSEQEIEDILTREELTLEPLADFLIEAANRKGGVDNISIVLGRWAAASERATLLERMVVWARNQ